VSAEEPGADAPTRGRVKPLGRAIQPYGTPLWLLALAIVFGVAAYLIYPTDAPAAPGNAVEGVAVLADFTPSGIAVSQTPDAAVNGFKLQIIVYAKRRVSHTGYVTIALPATAWGQSGCPHPAVRCSPNSTGVKNAEYVLPARWSDAGKAEAAADSHELRQTVTVSDIGTNVSLNAEYVGVLTPPIEFLLAPVPFRILPSYPYVKVLGVYAEQVPNGNAYTWTTGATPVYVNGFDRWTGTTAGALQDAASPTLDSGTNLTLQAQNGNYQFITGILVGIAGGALVGSLQEFLACRRKAEQAARAGSD
jgi:hypothetical protein